MAAAEAVQHSNGLERHMHTGSSGVRTRTDGDRVSNLSNGTVLRSSVETRASPQNAGSPAKLPRGLGGMLKTGTETGEIGIFSIKPSRVRQNLSNSPPRRMNGSGSTYMFQGGRAYNPHRTDDRRRLPSYNRDASSEVISMYETASQKSPRRRHDDPDYRSYSMTQPIPQHALANHRSYSSLRSQPEGSVQRPISPFAYPARLRRPGFRPSSPALTDGGGIDYTRRAEIERVHGPRSSSPSSLYAHRRRPPPLRQNANKSNPSFLSQTSPPRRSTSPFTQQESGTLRNDYYRRNGYGHPTSINSSPARSTFSLASTTNFYQAAAPQSTTQSTTTTPGKIPPPSPLYYDYTEDFDVEEPNQLEPLDPPPQFRIEKTIPEDRPMSSHWQAVDIDISDSPKKPFNSGVRSSSLPPTMRIGISQNGGRGSLGGRPMTVAPFQQLDIPAVKAFNDTSDISVVSIANNKKVIRLSGLGFGAQQLNSHVDEAFGLSSSPLFEVVATKNFSKGSDDQVNGVNTQLMSTRAESEDGTETQSIRTSTYSLNTQLQKFPPPPEETSRASVLASLPNGERASRDRERNSPRPIKRSQSPHRLKKTTGHDGTTDDEFQSTLFSVGKKRTSIVAEMDSPDLTELITSLEDSSRQRKNFCKPPSQDASIQASGTTFRELDASYPSNSSSHNRVALSLSYLQQSGHKPLEPVPELLIKLAHRPSKKRRVDVATVPMCGEKHVPNFSHQIPRRIMSRSDAPMLAPKPISPARQLKLKNSIPQLMKALPPVPPDTIVRGVTPPPQLPGHESQLPCQFSPLIQEARSSTLAAAQETTALTRIHESGLAESLSPKELDSLSIKPFIDILGEDNIPPTLQHPKLKLKLRNSGGPPPSPSASRPWNLDASYPWSSQVNVNLQSIAPKVQLESEFEKLKQPKFKLKVTRASNSTLGTVRVNRESAESRPGLQFKNPKDLFTPNAELDSVFQKVGKHLHLRKVSNNSQSVGSKKSQNLGQTADQASGNHLQIESRHSSPIDHDPASPTEVRSFFSDNSSRANERSSLRNRLSKFKARITLPYMSRIRAQSHDDITWRGRVEGLLPKAARSHPNLQLTRVSTNAHPSTHGIHRITERIRNHRLRARVSEWFKEARLAFRSRMKPRSVHSQTADNDIRVVAVV